MQSCTVLTVMFDWNDHMNFLFTEYYIKFISYSEPLFAELQQTLWTNEIKIYQEYVVKGTHQVKKLYYFTENCNEKLDITEVCTGVLVQLL